MTKDKSKDKGKAAKSGKSTAKPKAPAAPEKSKTVAKAAASSASKKTAVVDKAASASASASASAAATEAKIGVQPSTKRSHILLFHNLNQMIADIFDAETGGFPTTTQYELFNAIHSMDGPSQTQLGHATMMDRSTVAEVLKRMQARNAINRVRLPTDERSFSITLTEKGRDALARGHKAMKVVEQRLASAEGFATAVKWATVLIDKHEKKGTTHGKEPSPKISRSGPTGGNFHSAQTGRVSASADNSSAIGSARTRPFSDDERTTPARTTADA